jgi:anti-sigma regulatory factor (Ser/Thr protein kinase)
MEWALNSPTPESVAALRREVMAYLRRHAEPDSDLAGAEVVVAELLLNAFQHAPGPAWVRIGWSGERPRLEVHDLGEGFVLDALPEPSAERGRGLFLVNALADDLDVGAKPGGGSCQSALGRPLGALTSAHLRTLTVIRMSRCSEQPNLYRPGTVSLRLKR